MNGVIYARYSSERQTEQSIEGQLRDCGEFAKQNNIKIVATYIDRAKTGLNDNREEFQRMLHDSANKNFEKVIVWKIDRFGRSREDIAKNRAILRMNGVSVVSAKENIPEGAEGIILEALLEGLAEYYSFDLKEKITRGMTESAYKCQFNGSGLALGYKVDENHVYHVDELGARVVKRIFDAFIGGKTMADIRRELNDDGIRTKRGKEFTNFGISRILKNRQYVGEYKWSDIVVPNGMPRIIDDETFNEVQMMLDKNKKTPARKHGEENFLLTGKVFCGKCGATMAGDSGTSKSGNKFYYYSCRNKKTKHTCDKKSVKRDWLENIVINVTVSEVLRDDVIDYIAERIVAVEIKRKEDVSTLNALEAKLKETEKTIANIMKAIEAGIFTETTGARLRELEEERDRLRTDIVREKIESPITEKDEIVFFLERFRDGDVNDPAFRQLLVDTFVNRVYVYDDKLRILYNYSGEGSEITADLAENLPAEDIPGDLDALSECSTASPSGPP